MRSRRYVAFAVTLILIVYLLYWGYFAIHLGYEVAVKPEVWGQFGDYIGGVLNPLLSFISIALLIKSLTLQNEANQSLKNELKNTERIERLRSFEILFFNLLDAQKNLFSSFEICIAPPAKSVGRLHRAQAVIAIEDQIEQIRVQNGCDEEISNYLFELDAEDQIFGIVRAFYVAVATISEKLSDSHDFSVEDRIAHYRALVNFTDFSQLRLVVIAMQFLDFHSTRYLRASGEFNRVIEELGLRLDHY